VTVDNFAIRNLIIHNVRQAGAAIDLWTSCHDGYVSNNVFDLNRVGLGINVLDTSSSITIANNQFYYPYDSAIDFTMDQVAETNPVQRCVAIGNTIIKNSADIGYGIACHNNVENIAIIGNVIEGAGYDGIGIMQSSGKAQPRNISILGNTIKGTSRHGINMQGRYCKVVGNDIRLCASGGSWPNGIGIPVIGNDNIISANHILNNIRGVDVGTGGSTTTGTIISGNRITDDRGSAVQDYGIAINANCDYATILGNDLRGNVTAGVYKNATGTSNCKIRDNQGYITENSGVAENVDLDASGIGAIAHGCSATPTVANVQCQSAQLNVRISSIDATNINIVVYDLDNAIVTADTHDFYWEAKVR